MNDKHVMKLHVHLYTRENDAGMRFHTTTFRLFVYFSSFFNSFSTSIGVILTIFEQNKLAFNIIIYEKNCYCV